MKPPKKKQQLFTSCPCRSLLSSSLLRPLILLLLFSGGVIVNYAAAKEVSPSSSPKVIDLYNGHSNLLEGQRLYHRGQYIHATPYLWRAVLLQPKMAKMASSAFSSDSHHYEVDDAFALFLQCYYNLDQMTEGLVFVAAESYLRGQNEMGELYLNEAFKLSSQHVWATKLKSIVTSNNLQSVVTLAWIKEVRDAVDVALSYHNDELQQEDDELQQEDDEADDDNNTLKVTKTTISSDRPSYNDDNNNNTSTNTLIQLSQKYQHNTPEEIYNIGTYYFNTKHLGHAEQLFQLSCIKSNTTLFPACTNAVYIRSNLCMWGENGMGFNRDMDVIRRVTRLEMEWYRSVRKLNDDDDDDDDNDDNFNNNNNNNNKRRMEGISHLKANQDYISWNRATSVNPHMMLGYPFTNDDVMLKRYTSESMACFDELRARLEESHHDGNSGSSSSSTSIRQLPGDLPYSVMELQEKFVKKYNTYKETTTTTSPPPPPPIKVGFVAGAFNTKAVLFLSHDIFRFFDPTIVEIHIFSTGKPDHPLFIQNTMRGVDWRQRVMDNVDYFHDVMEYAEDHIGLARYIHNLEIQILIEWDGYARQGGRNAGLMALRPASIQILHQEFLLTSGAQYIDYIITDKIVSPLRLEGLYTEKFLWLPNHFFSKGHAMQREVHPPQLEYLPKEKGSEFQLGVGSPQENACLSSNPLGRRRNKEDNDDDDDEQEEVSFVYCNFNKFLKHNPETVRSWIRILNDVPNSILCLLENPAEGIPHLRKFVTEASSNSDSSGDDVRVDLNARIHFLPWEGNPFDHQQRSYSLCNAMLDSHPYNGHTTAQDALYAGVPIVTRSDGDDMSSRVSTSANVVLGLEELNAYRGIEEYETIAIRLGIDKDWFVYIRTKLIETCLQKNPMHPYWDVPRYVNNFQNGLRKIWDNFLRGNEIDHVEVTEEGGEQGTMETEIVAREEKRKKAKDVREQRRSHAVEHVEL